MKARDQELLERLRQSRRLLAIGSVERGKELLGDLKLYETELPSGELHAVRALLHQLEGRFDQAIEEWQNAVKVQSDETAFYIGLASSLRQLGRTSEASSWLRQAIKLHPQAPGLRQALSEVYQELGLYAEAAGEAETLIRLQPQSPHAYDLLVIAYYQQGKLPEALSALGRLIRLEPTEPYHRFKLGVLLQQQGQLRRAMQEYERTLQLDAKGELADIALEAMASLDAMQMQQVMMRAVEDRLFRLKLARDPIATLDAHGYHLSDLGLETFRTLDWEHHDQPPGPSELIH